MTHKLVAIGFILAMSLGASAHETAEKVQAPGFRPGSELAGAFIDDIKQGESTITVLPAIIRTKKKAWNILAPQKQALDLIKKNGYGKGKSSKVKVDLSKVKGHTQWEMFNSSIDITSGTVRSQKDPSDYYLLMEYLVPIDKERGIRTFGIHCLILDRNGNDAFSFLLNSHHQPFVDANLSSKETTREAKQKVFRECATVCLKAFEDQIHQATHASESDGGKKGK